MVRQPESVLVGKIMAALKTHAGRDGWFVKIHGGPMQRAGLPDIIGCYKGRFVAFEVKVPGKEGTLSRMQVAIFARIRQSGGVPKLVTSPADATKALWKLDMYETQRESEDL